MGKEKATGVDKVTSNFSSGVRVQIMQIGMPWAMPAMQHYEPEDGPTPKENCGARRSFGPLPQVPFDGSHL